MTPKLMILLIIVVAGPLQLTLVTMSCISSDGPSPYEYGIDQQMQQRSDGTNMVAGWRQYGDHLLFETNVSAEKINGKIVTTTLQYPTNGGTGSRVITHVLSLNQERLYGAVAYIMEGGIGFTYVKIGFQSQKNYGINHLVKIYATETKFSNRIVP